MVRQGAVAGGVSPSPAVLRGVGPGEAGPPLSPGFTSGTRARGRETPGSGFLRAAPPGPSPTAVGSAAQGDAGTVTSPGRADAVGVVAEPGHPAPLCFRTLPAGGFGHRARGLAWQRSEKREALRVGFARSL